MSRAKCRKLWNKYKEQYSGVPERGLSEYQQAVYALHSAASLHYLPLGSLRTGNAPNDLLLTWKEMWL